MKGRERLEIAGLAAIALFVFVPVISGNTALTATSAPATSCSLSFSGTFESLRLAPAGSWSLTSSSCTVTGQSQGITSGTFAGAVTSGEVTGVVTGTWSVSGSASKVTASSTVFTLSFYLDQDVEGMPVGGPSYQGIMSANPGSMLLVIGTAGQVTLN